MDTSTLPAPRAFRGEARLLTMLAGLAFGLSPMATFALSVPHQGASGGALHVLKLYALPTLAAELVLIGLSLSVARRPLLALPRWIRTAALALTLVAVAAIPRAPEPLFAAGHTLLWLVHIFFAVSVARLCAAGLLRPRDMMAGMAAGLCVLAPLTVIYAVQVPDPDSFDWANDLPGFDHLRRFGYYAAPIGALTAGQVALSRTVRARAWWAVPLVIAVTLTAWTGSRGGLVALAAALAGGFVLFPALRSRVTWPWNAGAVGAGVLIAYLLPRPGALLGFGRMAEAGGTSNGRTILWQETFAEVLNRPWFGHGEAQAPFTVPFAEMIGTLHPHNLPLQMLLAWGVVGTALAIGLALPIALKLFAGGRRRGSALLSPVLAMATLLVFSLYDGTLFHIQASATFFACAGLALGLERQESA